MIILIKKYTSNPRYFILILQTYIYYIYYVNLVRYLNGLLSGVTNLSLLCALTSLKNVITLIASNQTKNDLPYRNKMKLVWNHFLRDFFAILSHLMIVLMTAATVHMFSCSKSYYFVMIYIRIAIGYKKLSHNKF